MRISLLALFYALLIRLQSSETGQGWDKGDTPTLPSSSTHIWYADLSKMSSNVLALSATSCIH